MRNKAAYKAAVTHFNRVGGQLKRYHDVDPQSYLEGITTVKGVERALDRMRFDAEREDIDQAIAEYERAFDEAMDEQLKEENTQEMEDREERARQSLNENWDLDWTETDSRIFWNAFDDADIMDAFGSEQVIDMGNAALADNKITTRQAAEIAKNVAAQVPGHAEWSAEDVRDEYDQKITEYKKLRGTLTHSEAIEEIFR